MGSDRMLLGHVVGVCLLWSLLGEPIMWMISGMVNVPMVCWLAMWMIRCRCFLANHE